jgi:hypothetical protein
VEGKWGLHGYLIWPLISLPSALEGENPVGLAHAEAAAGASERTDSSSFSR